MKTQKHTLEKYLFDIINPLLLLLSLSHWLGVGSTNYCIVAIAYPPHKSSSVVGLCLLRILNIAL